MLQVTVLAHDSHADVVVRRLQDAGAVEIERIALESDAGHEAADARDDRDDGPRATDAGEATVTRPSIDEHRRHVLDRDIARAQFVRDFLGRYHTAEVTFGAFIAEKVHLLQSEYDTLAPDAEFDELYEACETISARLGEIERERTHLNALIHDLAPWRDLHLQIGQWSGTEHVALFAGTVPAARSVEIRQSLREAVSELSIAEVGQDHQREAWIVMAHHSALEPMRAALALTEFTEVSFPGLHDYPAEEIEDAKDALADLIAEEARLNERAAELEHNYERAVALVQALLTARDAIDVRDDCGATERTFLVHGWLPATDRDRIAIEMESIGDEIDIDFREPSPGERVPVALTNPWYIRPFEVLTDLYGRPAYGDIDPTPLLAGFFFLFFGMALGDAGYGVALMIATYLMKTKLDIGPGVKRFMDLLFAGGLASVIVGVATRSYFALSANELPSFLRYEPLLDPLEDIIVLLIVSVAIGVVHVVFGVLINAYRLIKAGDWMTAVQQDISSILLLAGLGATFALGSVDILYWTAAIAIVLKGQVLESLFVDRKPLSALLGIPKGLLGLYSITGYVSDFLSYTRLAALGLASLLVGQVMNILANMVSGAPWGIGFVAAALILVVGHAFNLVINLLGAFVHPTRLQFVEFFGKFYEAGGRSYTPFARRTKSLVLHPVPGEQKGGTRS